MASQRRLGDDWADWLDRLPRLTDDLLDAWRLTPDGEPMHGHASLVIPVTGADGDAVLKIGFDSPDTAQEHLALQHWAGDGAVAMHRADPRHHALLLERLHPQDLTREWDVQACQIVADLYGRLHKPAPNRLATLSSRLRGWLDALECDVADLPMPPRLVEQAVARGWAFVDDPGTDGTMIHGDLHYENVLAADREPWLAIDPQPMSGDPHYEVAPLLWNRWDEMEGYLRGSIQTRFHATVEAAGFDDDRARDWVIVRMVLNAHWTVEDAKRLGRGLTDDERTWITTCVSVAKGVQR
nr:aminoglycoside phosphotransferase family protein [Gordonia humi]